jgi:cold shock CspA family protein
MRGTVKFYNGPRAFGFIVPDGDNGGIDIFYHGTMVEGTFPREGDPVDYELAPPRHDGKIRAHKVRLA